MKFFKVRTLTKMAPHQFPEDCVNLKKCLSQINLSVAPSSIYQVRINQIMTHYFESSINEQGSVMQIRGQTQVLQSRVGYPNLIASQTGCFITHQLLDFKRSLPLKGKQPVFRTENISSKVRNDPGYEFDLIEGCNQKSSLPERRRLTY